MPQQIGASLIAATMLLLVGVGCSATESAATAAAPSASSRPPTIPSSTTTTVATTAASSEAPTAAIQLVRDARAQVGVTTSYDGSYVAIDYPGGDVPMSTGVCTDVVIRALRKQGIDLQVRVHEDMKANFRKYPKTNLKKPDRNIDHRRVPNIATYFTRRGYSIPVKADYEASPSDFRPGDIVWIKLPLNHMGIVSDRTVDGRPLLIHNVGSGAREEDVLFQWKIVGHYRVLT